MIDPDNRIEELLSAGFERDLYFACLENASDNSNRLRLSNFAFAMRELMRHVLNRLAPDESVIQCIWFEQTHQDVGKATGAQKALYAVQGGLSADYVKDVLGLDVGPIVKHYNAAIRELSQFTHVTQNVFELDAESVDESIGATNEAVGELFETISSLRKDLGDSLWQHIDSAVVNEALSESIQAFDEAASHHSVDEVGVEEVVVFKIDHEMIRFHASGWITAELQWGSNSDIRNGDGATGSMTSNFECQLTSPVDDPESVSVDENTLGVEEGPWRMRENEDE